MTFSLDELLASETLRHREFPVTKEKIFLAHAGVTALPRTVAEAVTELAVHGTRGNQEMDRLWPILARARLAAATLIDAHPDEIALLGPTSLGLSLIANGLEWNPGDELVCYADDYPANVYPWAALESRGVVVQRIRTGKLGALTPQIVEAHLTDRTRMVCLATVNYLSGYRIDTGAIGTMLQGRNILFCLDGIQSVGQAPTTMGHADFLSADSHKWMLGPLAAGIVCIKRKHFGRVTPTLLGAWNVKSPNFITQEQIDFEETARRYEPGAVNLLGIAGMTAALELILHLGVDSIRSHLLSLRGFLAPRLRERGYDIIDGGATGESLSAILTVSHPAKDLKALAQTLLRNRVEISSRTLRDGTPVIRFSPHFYNTQAELEQVLALM
ncbi:MAG: aminotransferase class V-fold PLP-dependent enzyme [Verrucomicrobiae bacterium]|nr:aminotransferase class V-fold PLP-dependent enzyme [Verrucomicrobiae bacterium]